MRTLRIDGFLNGDGKGAKMVKEELIAIISRTLPRNGEIPNEEKAKEHRNSIFDGCVICFNPVLIEPRNTMSRWYTH